MFEVAVDLFGSRQVYRRNALHVLFASLIVPIFGAGKLSADAWIAANNRQEPRVIPTGQAVSA